MARRAGRFDIEERLRELSAKGDDLERVNALGISTPSLAFFVGLWTTWTRVRQLMAKGRATADRFGLLTKG